MDESKWFVSLDNVLIGTVVYIKFNLTHSIQYAPMRQRASITASVAKIIKSK